MSDTSDPTSGPAGDAVAVLAEIRDLLAASAGPEPLLLTCEQAARYVSLGESTFRRAAAGLDVPRPVATPGGPRWRVSELKRWVEQLKVRRRARKAVVVTAGEPQP